MLVNVRGDDGAFLPVSRIGMRVRTALDEHTRKFNLSPVGLILSHSMYAYLRAGATHELVLGDTAEDRYVFGLKFTVESSAEYDMVLV